VPRKSTGKRKHIPQRTCVACREVLAKRSLIRIVRSAEGVKVDPSGKLAGRGAYLHDVCTCWQRGLKGSLEAALKVNFSDQEREQLTAYMLTLSEKDDHDGSQAEMSSIAEDAKGN
jgi:uncharacterized protein